MDTRNTQKQTSEKGGELRKGEWAVQYIQVKLATVQGAWWEIQNSPTDHRPPYEQRRQMHECTNAQMNECTRAGMHDGLPVEPAPPTCSCCSRWGRLTWSSPACSANSTLRRLIEARCYAANEQGEVVGVRRVWHDCDKGVVTLGRMPDAWQGDRESAVLTQFLCSGQLDVIFVRPYIVEWVPRTKMPHAECSRYQCDGNVHRLHQ